MSELDKAYALLASLKQNVPDHYEVEQAWVDDYHSILGKIEEASGQDLKDFRVAGNDLHRQVISANYITGEIEYGERLCNAPGSFSRLMPCSDTSNLATR